jgi:uncharacterized phage protein (TIGR01671 family)
MKQIKFRAFNKVWGMMLPVDSIDFEQERVCVTVEASDYSHKNEWQDYIIGEEIVLMQWTGLLDKNGKEIYEGDIIRNGTSIGVVEFGDFQCDTGFEGHKEDIETIQAYYMKTESGNKYNIYGEIIGNIYDKKGDFNLICST